MYSSMDSQNHRVSEMMSPSAPSPASSLSVLNPHPQLVPGPALLHDLVKITSPDNLPAIDYQAANGAEKTVAYSELHSQAETLARRILAALPETQGPEQLVVPILLPQSPELYISQLAILKAGGAFCPLNLDAPPERVRFIFGDVSAKVVITSNALRSKVDALESSVTVVVADQDDDDHNPSRPEPSLPQEISPDSLAYVMYTSGSTGTPKGVGVPHSAATQALLAHHVHIPPFSRFLQFAAPTFDVSVFEIFFPLFRGATLVSSDRAAMLNDLPAVLRERNVDACELTPTVAGSLLRTRANAPGLRVLLTIGEMLTEPVIREFGGDADKPSVLWAMYGPTEATIHCTLQPACEASSSPNSVGFPLDTVSTFILEPSKDDELGPGEFRVLPLGETGELAVGGHQTAVGYINRPEQTAKVFIDSPYGRLYRTGDKARICDDGTIECFGRIADGQVKLRGQRIELGEVEQAVLRVPECHGVVAAVVRGVIVVFCERDGAGGDAVEQVLRVCRDWLPSFMVPGDVVLTRAFPRLPSGKVDRKQLKANYELALGEDVESSSEFVDDVERHLARLAEEALGVRLKPSSALSAAGVDSLAAIKLASRLRQAGFMLDAIDVLSSKTLTQLRSRIQPAEASTEGGIPESKKFTVVDHESISLAAASLGVQVEAIEAVIPCAPIQVSMLAETLRNPEAYCNWIELQVPSTHAPETIKSWIRDLARCHEILRTGFVLLQGKFRQVVWTELDSGQLKTVEQLRRSYQLDERGFARPLSVQILANESPKPTSVVLQTHHALYDGWSFDLLLADLNNLSSGHQVSKHSSFRGVSQYYSSLDFTRHADAARAYWAEHLLGFQPTPMPQLLAKQAKSGQILSTQRTLNVDASAIKALFTQLEISPQVLFQASLVWFWGSIIGTDDVVLGNVTSGRTIPVDGIEDVIGPCLTTIPVRTKISQIRTIKELLETVHASNRESLAHCTLPLADIKKATGVAPGQPLYDALFVYQESIPSRSGQQSAGEIRQVAHEDYLETKLLAEIEPTEEGFQLRVTYHADVFHCDYVQLLLRQFECVLAHLVRNVEADVSSVSSCFSENLLSTYNLSSKTFEGCPDIATLFERTAERQSHEPAICFADEIEDEGVEMKTISYGELNSLANRYARHLQSLGASEEHPVAIVMEKSITLYAGILGILKAGCAYLPLLPTTPKARIQTIFSQADVRICVSDVLSSGDLSDMDACHFTNLSAERLEKYTDTNTGTTAKPSRVANIIYTSGSTGVPKGVCVTQLNICSNLDVLSRIYPVKEESRMLQACSQAFDVSVFEILFALTRGMCLCAANNDVLFADLERSIRAMDVTHLSMTPTVASLVNPDNVPKVNFLVTSGEPMTSEVASQWMGKVYQGYGPSETTNICSVKKMVPDDHIRHLGHVFENTSTFVLSPTSSDPTPIGCAGELCFGGDQVVSGYLNLPDVTREKFVTHPRFGRIYRSGDIGRMLADGSLLIVGRVDDQVKLRGQRIELGEVNSVVAACTAVTNCVTMLVGQDAAQRHLACFYVPRSGDGAGFHLLPAAGGEVRRMSEVIHDALRARLPGYMVPAYLVPISTVPMTTSGKVDRAKLRDVFGNLGPRELEALGSNFEAGEADGDWSEHERMIGAVVADVLHISLQDVRMWTPLSSLGLDSISAISLAKGLHSAFSRRVPISAILQNASVARLAALLSTRQAESVRHGERLDIFPLEFVEHVRQQINTQGLEVEQVLPCTPLQEAMLASSTSDASYLNKMLFRLNVDPSAMGKYWTTMFRRHGTLRTCFFSTNDREYTIAQCVLKSWEPEWLVFDSADGSLDGVVHKHAEAIPAAIDSGRPPISLAEIHAGEDTYVSFVCHHAMYDGVAISRLLEEIELVASGHELQPAPSYEPFLKEMLALPESTNKFWAQHMEGLRTKPLPRAPEAQAGRGVLMQHLDISYSEVDAGLRALNVSLLTLMQVSWSTLLRIVLQSDDVCFGNVVNGRSFTVERVDELVAPCFNTIPTRIDFQKNRRNLDLMRSFQALNPELLQYQFTPPRRIQSLCSTNGARLFDTLLLLQQPSRPLDENLWVLERDDGEMDFPLVCEVTPDPDQDWFDVRIHFDRSHVSSSFASFIYDTLLHVISFLLRYPSSHSISTASLPPALQARLDSLKLVRLDPASGETSPHFDKGESWSDAEKSIRLVISTISEVKEDKITRHTTIFQLGLDSINAVQVAAMLRKQGFEGIAATDVLEHPSCSKLASKLAVLDSTLDGCPQYDLARFQQEARHILNQSVSNWETVETLLPCTALQMGMLTEFVNSQGQDYLNFISFRVDTGITASVLKNAWVSVIKADPILRTGFTSLDLEDASFAMLQYNFDESTIPNQIQTYVGNFNVTDWQRDTARAVFNDLSQPPWRMMIIDGSEGVDMHLAIHHVIYDAHSLKAILGHLSQALQGRLMSSQLDASAALQDIMTQTLRCKNARTFWEKQAAKTVVNKFPVMTPLREEKRDILVRSLVSSLSFPALEQAVRNTGFTVQAVAQAAWLRILSSYLGEPAVVFGTILSGRNSEATHDAMFPCITTLPVISQNSSSNRELLQSMMQYNTELQRYQRTPLTDIQRWLGHPNTKIFDTLLVYQRFEREAALQEPWHITDEKATVDYPVSLEIEPQGNSVMLRVTFFSDVLPVGQAELLLRQFDASFCDLAQHADGREERLLDSHPELFALLKAEDPVLKSKVTFLHELVENTAQNCPERTALEFVSSFERGQPVSRKWTYTGLDMNGNRVAHMLSKHVKTGDIVAVCFDKCPEAHFAMLGILKAGCALLALDPGAPSSRKEFILQDSGAAVLLMDKARSLDLDFKVEIPVIVIGEEVMAAASAAPPKLTRPLTPQDRSYCLYTSGTTGTPKGCEITHENAVQAMLAFQKLFEGHWDHDSKWLQFASYHFDVSVLEQYWTWSVGIALVAAPRDVILEDLAGTISRLEITHIDLTPSLARLLHPDDVPSLCRGVFITGGEQLKQEILDVWGPKRVIHNFYGPTEATIGVTTYPCVPINGRSSNIGRQFANVGSYVLRPGTDDPVLRGGIGELCVSGKLVGKGYLNRDDLTAERFPVLKAFNERVYRTGDLVRVLHDGCFDFLGRADDQVKLRGQRLEIGEINHCIRSGVSGISDVVTLVIRNEKQQKDLLASFVVTERDQKSKNLEVINGEEAASITRKVQQACRNKLPGYMVPTYVLLLPFIPLSPNNKAEVKDLRVLFSKLSPDQLMSPSAPSSVKLGDVGRKICKALSIMFSVLEESISPTTSIFELGVDSISVMRFARALKREGMKHATPAVILRNPTVADLAHALKSTQALTQPSTGVLEARQAVEACQHRHRGTVCRALGVTPHQIEYIAPCSALQQGMISRSRTEGNEGAYFNDFRYELAGVVDLAKLRSAWASLTRENSVLRTKFVSTTEGYVQVALMGQEISWTDVKLSDTDTLERVLADRRASWIESNHSSIQRALEFLTISHGEKQLLVVNIFHAIYDANSFDLMVEEVARRYRGEEVPIQSPSFLDALLRGPLRNHSSCKDFWTQHFKEFRLTPCPQLSETPSHQDLSISRRVPFDALEKARKALGVTQQSIVQTLWSIVLQRQFTSGVTFGIIVSGRSIELDNVDRTIGPLFNTIPYHHRITQGQSWTSAIRQCHDFNTATLPFQHVPLRDVQKWCSGGQPLFDTLFSFQRAATTSEASLGLWTEIESNVNPDYPLAFEATLLPSGSLQILVVTQKRVADEEALNGILDDFESVAKAVTDDPDGLVTPDSIDVQTKTQYEAPGIDRERQPSTRASSSLHWTPEANAIRREIALLAGIGDSSITASTTLLELGLDSIDTIKLSARLKRAGISLSNSELVKGQSIDRLQLILQDQQVGTAEVHDSGYSSDVENPSIFLAKHMAGSDHDLTNVQQVLPPTALQDSMVSEMIHSDFQTYFNHDVLEVSHDVDLEKLKRAWNTVIENSPILRTVFVEVGSPEFDFAYAQLVIKDQTPHFGNVAIQSLDEISFIMEQARSQARQGQGRANLLQIDFARSTQKTYVILSISHALYDGWSLGLLHKDVEAAYHDRYLPREDYTAYLGDMLRSAKDDARGFWSDYVSDASPTLFPARLEDVDSFVNRAEATLGITASALKSFCKRHAVSQQAVAQACWAAVLATHCQRLDVTFGVVLSGRETEASEAIMFPTMNTVPVRVVFHGSVSTFLQYVQDNVTNINQSQHFPLRKIQGLVNDRQGTLFNTLFILQKSSIGDDDSLVNSGEPLMKSIEGSSAVEYPVCVEMETAGETITWRTACQDGYLSTDQTKHLLQELEATLNFLVNSSDNNVLMFSDEGVSICGLPSFQPRTPEVTETDQPSQVDDEEKWSPTEETIRDVLGDMSGVEKASISKNHNLYHLGLDSISAIKVSSALRKRGVNVTVREMMQATSIKDMSTRVTRPPDSQTATLGNSSTTPVQMLDDVKIDKLLESAGIDAGHVEETLPATAMQTHMLSVSQKTCGDVFFPEFRYRLSGVSQSVLIENSWRDLVEQLPILRTVFLATGSDKPPFVQIVLRHDAEIEHPFVKFNAQQQGADTWIISLRIHHALYDGVSLPLIVDQFKRLLTKHAMKYEHDDHALRKWKEIIVSSLSERAIVARKTFWTSYLQDAHSTPFITSASTSPTSTSNSSQRVSLLQRSALLSTTYLKTLCAEHGLGIQAVFLAAYAQVIASLSGRQLGVDQDIVLGVYLANRGTDDQQLLYYPTLCLVPLRVRVSRDRRIEEVAKDVQLDLHRISAPENVGVGLWEIREWTGVVVDSFVNFLSLPEDSGKSGLQGATTGGVQLEGVGFDAMSASSETNTGLDSSSLSWLEKNAVRDAYPDAVDVEASLQGDGALDIGVFGSREKLGVNGAGDVVRMMIDILSA